MSTQKIHRASFGLVFYCVSEGLAPKNEKNKNLYSRINERLETIKTFNFREDSKNKNSETTLIVFKNMVLQPIIYIALNLSYVRNIL